jgi:hypothetical protein
VTRSWTVPEIEPLRPPALDGPFQREVEVIHLLPNDKVDPYYNVGSAAPVVALDEEYLLPQALVRFDAKEGLADGDKYCEVHDGIWCQLPKLNVVGEQEAAEEFVGWKR